MNKTEAQYLMYNKLIPFFEGYKGIQKRKFIKRTLDGFNGFAFGMVDFNPIQRCRFSVFKRLNSIEDVMDVVIDRYDINYYKNKNAVSLTFGYKLEHGDIHLPDMINEEDVANSAKLIIDFMNEVGFPLLEKFNDIREIDNEINGENFWETDWRMPFNLGGGFNCKRLIIAHLCSNPKFEELYNFHIAVHEQAKIDYPEYPEQLIDGENYLQYLKRILLDIKPLY